MNQLVSQHNLTSTSEIVIIVIGGFVFNHVPTSVLNQLRCKIKFIDINSFTAPFSINDITQNIGQIINSYEQPVSLIGYSTGGLIAIQLTIEIPHLINKIVLINSTPCFLSKKNWHGIRAQDLWRLSKKLTDLSLEQFKHHFSCLAAYPQVYKLIELSKWQSSYSNKANLTNWLEIIATTDLRPQLAQLSRPGLIVYAEHDHLVPNSNDLGNELFSQCTLKSSSHVRLDSSALINQVEQFIL